MNRLKREKQKMILSLLVEGNSVRGIERITGVHRDTIIRLMIAVGQNCQEQMNQRFKGLQCQFVECDEVWTYVGKKQAKLTDEERYRNLEIGDQYVFVALDRETKLVPLFSVGKRNRFTTTDFMLELSNLYII